MIDAVNYLSSVRYCSGRIIEYDIKSANINCLISADKISLDDYMRLSNLPKQQREVEIGLRIKEDPSLYTTISSGIREAKKYLFSNNPIDDEQVLRIANDAVYINAPYDLENLSYNEYIRFVPKSISNIYLNLLGIVIFIKYLDDGNIDVDVKGINKNNLSYHNALLSEIVSIILILERSGVRDAINYLSNIIEQYLHYQLPVEFYREFNSYSQYRLKGNNLMIFNDFDYSINANENNKYSLDINYNYSILRELWSILIEIYNIRRK